jgi:hypothetical protein
MPKGHLPYSGILSARLTLEIIITVKYVNYFLREL